MEFELDKNIRFVDLNFNPNIVDSYFQKHDFYLYDFDLFNAILTGKCIDVSSDADFINI